MPPRTTPRRPLRAVVRALGLTSLLAGCGQSVGVSATFTDDLVEAPARSLSLTFLSSSSCDAVLSALPATVATLPNALATRDYAYPLDPSQSDVFDDLPSDTSITVDAVARSSTGLVIARGCRTFTIDALEEPAEIPLRALPECANTSTRLDVTLVIDTSVRMALADQEAAHIPELMAAVLDPVGAIPDTLWSVITYGHADEVLLEPTTDLTAVRTAVNTLQNLATGQPRLFDAMAKATERARARAVCGLRPVIFVVASYRDEGSARSFTDAQVGIIGARGDATDDLYLMAVTLTDEAYIDVDGMAPMPVEALVMGAGSRAQMAQSFRDGRDKIIELSRPKTN